MGRAKMYVINEFPVNDVRELRPKTNYPIPRSFSSHNYPNCRNNVELYIYDHITAQLCKTNVKDDMMKQAYIA